MTPNHPYPSIPESQPEKMTFQEVLEELQIDEEELKRLVSNAELRSFKDGGRMVFKRDDVLQLKEGRETEPTIILTDSDTELGVGEATDELILEDVTGGTVINIGNIMGGREDKELRWKNIPNSPEELVGERGTAFRLRYDRTQGYRMVSDVFPLAIMGQPATTGVDVESIYEEDDGSIKALHEASGGPRKKEMISLPALHRILTRRIYFSDSRGECLIGEVDKAEKKVLFVGQENVLVDEENFTKMRAGEPFKTTAGEMCRYPNNPFVQKGTAAPESKKRGLAGDLLKGIPSSRPAEIIFDTTEEYTVRPHDAEPGSPPASGKQDTVLDSSEAFEVMDDVEGAKDPSTVAVGPSMSPSARSRKPLVAIGVAASVVLLSMAAVLSGRKSEGGSRADEPTPIAAPEDLSSAPSEHESSVASTDSSTNVPNHQASPEIDQQAERNRVAREAVRGEFRATLVELKAQATELNARLEQSRALLARWEAYTGPEGERRAENLRRGQARIVREEAELQALQAAIRTTEEVLALSDENLRQALDALPQGTAEGDVPVEVAHRRRLLERLLRAGN